MFVCHHYSGRYWACASQCVWIGNQKESVGSPASSRLSAIAEPQCLSVSCQIKQNLHFKIDGKQNKTRKPQQLTNHETVPLLTYSSPLPLCLRLLSLVKFPTCPAPVLAWHQLSTPSAFPHAPRHSRHHKYCKSRALLRKYSKLITIYKNIHLTLICSMIRGVDLFTSLSNKFSYG